MDKEEAMKILKDFHDKSALFSVRTALETLHPKLKESEDEKIRKTLKHYLEVRRCQTQSDEEYINCNNFLAWLEKQGKEDSSIQQAYEWGYTEGKRIERKHWVEKQKFSEDYNSIDPQFGKPIEQNPAWSEEDEEMFEYTISLLNYNLGCRKWLKSLKERYTWKPSDEQMEALFVLLPTVSYGRNPAFSLYNDLKKLKE